MDVQLKTEEFKSIAFEKAYEFVAVGIGLDRFLHMVQEIIQKRLEFFGLQRELGILACANFFNDQKKRKC